MTSAPMHSLLGLTIVYEDAADGCITASVAEVPGANSQGKTRAEARENVPCGRAPSTLDLVKGN